jgi:signal transduction histidine kinase/ActR/RegA family two-component response regulator
MRWIQRLSVQNKLRAMALVSCVLALTSAAAGFLIHDISVARTAKVQNLRSQAEILAFNASPAIVFQDYEGAQNLLGSLHVSSTVQEGWIVDAQGRALASYSRTGAPAPPPPKMDFTDGVLQRFTADRRLEVCQPIVVNADKAGWVFIRADLSDLDRQILASLQIAGAVFAISLAVAFVLSEVVRRLIARPILHLAEAAERITNLDDCKIRVTPRSEDEIGSLYRAFNRMLERIETMNAALQRAKDELEDRVARRTAELSAEIERRERIQRDLERARDAAEAANRAKSEFLANMSHEIRTPLNAIIGFAEILHDDPEAYDERQRSEFLQNICVSGRRLADLIGDILDVSKIESGRLTIEKVDFSPHDAIAEVVSFLRVRASQKGLSLCYHWTSEIPATIRSDPSRFRQILVNLVGNAIKFTDHGEVRIVARVERTADPPKLVVDVKDAGIGIPEDKLDAIFEPFVQADASVTRRFGGTGLGLAISRRLVELLGGSIRVKSQVGLGSVFTFEVPTGPLDGVVFTPKPCPETFSRPSLESETRDSRKLAGVKILLVEDGEMNQKLLRFLLERAGAAVTSAWQGREGVEAARRNDFDLVLMDMQMPEMDGYQATRILREEGLTIPIIALTAHAMSGDREKCLEAGCSHYLTKPVNGAQLIAMVVDALGGRPPEETSAGGARRETPSELAVETAAP